MALETNNDKGPCLVSLSQKQTYQELESPKESSHSTFGGFIK
jgi:hypothetical protein